MCFLCHHTSVHKKSSSQKLLLLTSMMAVHIQPHPVDDIVYIKTIILAVQQG